MSEIIDLKDALDTPSYLAHLILESDRDIICEVTKSKDFNSKKIEVCVTLNGIEIRRVDLEVIFKDWAERLANQKLDKLDYNIKKQEYDATEEGINDRAVELAKKKLESMVDTLNWYEN